MIALSELPYHCPRAASTSDPSKPTWCRADATTETGTMAWATGPAPAGTAAFLASTAWLAVRGTVAAAARFAGVLAAAAVPAPGGARITASSPGGSVLVSVKAAGDTTPLAEVATVYVPATPLAVTDTVASPEESIVAVVTAGLVLAPEEGPVNVTTPPATGSSGLLAVTITTSGAPKAVLTGVLWLSPLTIVIVNPLDSKAPMSTMPLTIRGKPARAGRW